VTAAGVTGATIYATEEGVRRYRRRTAGQGINHLLPTTYGPIFVDAVRAALADTGRLEARLLEFGCGAGMAIQYLTQRLDELGVKVDVAVGTDLVPAMIEAATLDRDEFGSEPVKRRLTYAVAANEDLVAGVARALGASDDALAGTFQLAIGVNTFRYAIREGSTHAVVSGLRHLLAPGGRAVVIDMNGRFPYWLKRRRGPGGRRRGRGGAPHVPNLSEYAKPFAEGGFEVVGQANFCWVPHSATGPRFAIARAAGPLLQRLAPDHAMRSLVVARRVQ
jgi:SAM-dependent methyltransferase